MDDRSEKSAKNFGVADELTEIPAAMPFKPEPAAYLIAVNPAPHLPERITLHIGQVIRLGRRPDLNDVVIDDKQISRVHAIVTHKDKGFFIQDNGSTGGTYVNRRKLIVPVTINYYNQVMSSTVFDYLSVPTSRR